MSLEIKSQYKVVPILLFAFSVLFSSLCFIYSVNGAVLGLLFGIFLVVWLGVFCDKELFAPLVITVVITALSVWAACFIYDVSFDGLYFHKAAVHAVANGWSPIEKPFIRFSFFGRMQDLALWLDNYPKGVWAFYGAMYQLTGKLESAKGLNIIFMLMLFFTAYDTLKTVFNKKGILCLFLSLVFTLNPIVLSQFFTYMNDLPTALMIMVCAFIAMKIYSGKGDRWDYISLFLVFASSFAVKFTAPIFCGLVLLAYGVAYLIKYKGKDCVKPLITVVLAAVVGFTFMAADPYMKHIADDKHPLYPVMGEGKYDIMNSNAPAGFEEMSGARKLFVSLFSKAQSEPGAETSLKIPFSITAEDLESLKAPDCRTSGFGVWFGGLLIVSLLLFLVASLSKKVPGAIYPGLAIFVLLALVFPESWWARYNPYIYYIPCLCLLAFSFVGKTKILTLLVSIVFFINSGINGVVTAKNFYLQTKEAQKNLAEIKKIDKPLELRINDFPGHAFWFDEAGIDYKLSGPALGEGWQIFSGTTKYRIKPEE